MKIACVGEAMVEFSLSASLDSVRLGFAGDTLNTAIYLRRNLAREHEVAFVCVLGHDDLSERMISFIDRQGVSITHIGRHKDRLPGAYAISTDDKGERSFVYWRENSAARTLFQTPGGRLNFDQMRGFDVIYTSAITLAILAPPVRAAFLDWIVGFRQRGGTFVFDSNFRPGLWNTLQEARNLVERAWRQCDIALPSVDDERAIFGDPDTSAVLARFCQYGVPVGALKCGASGPLPINGEIDASVTFPPAENIVDTTAAGDSFSGAFLARILTGGTLTQAMRAGHACASEVVGHRGAIVETSRATASEN